MATQMQASNRLRSALLPKCSSPSFGAWMTLPGASHARVMCQSDFDWICVDTEHGDMDDGTMHQAVGAIAGCGVSPIVRIAGKEDWMIKRALDAGAHGIIVPLLRSAEDAQQVVIDAKFPPEGRRGLGSPFAMHAFAGVKSMTEYAKQANASLLTIIQIETKEALQNVADFGQIPGVDCLFVGPYDLGNSLGFPVRGNTVSSELQQAIDTIRSTAEKYGKATGIYASNGRQARSFADQGFQMICAAADADILATGLTSALSDAHGSLTHAALRVASSAVAGIGKAGGKE